MVKFGLKIINATDCTCKVKYGKSHVSREKTFDDDRWCADDDAVDDAVDDDGAVNKHCIAHLR